MLGSDILEVGIGLVLVYVLVSTICTIFREALESILKTRASYLEHGIRLLLHDATGDQLVKSLYSHPLINSLFFEPYSPSKSSRPGVLANGRKLPSYIPARNFALALMDLVARGEETNEFSSATNSPAVTLSTVRANVASIQNEPVQRVLLTLIDSSKGDIERFRQNIEAWFDSGMERISGRYKRSTQIVLFFIAFIVAVGGNINTITIADFLYRNDATRSALVARAQIAVNDSNYLNKNAEKVQAQLDSMHLPIGWSKGWGVSKIKNTNIEFGWWSDVFLHIIGLLLTTFAATLGAPFWFDVLSKFMVVRSTIKPGEKSSQSSGQETPSASQGVPGATPRTPEMNVTPTPTVRSLENIDHSSALDYESQLDGCDVDVLIVTNDEELPVSEGG